MSIAGWHSDRRRLSSWLKPTLKDLAAHALASQSHILRPARLRTGLCLAGAGDDVREAEGYVRNSRFAK